MGICYTRVNTEVVYHSFHSENCKYLLVLEEKLHSQPKYFLTSQKLCKQGLGLRLVLWPHILLYIMIVFLKFRACSIARKRVWVPVSMIVTVPCSQPQSQCKCASAQHDAQDLLIWWCWSWCGILWLWDPGGSASLKRMYGKLFAKGIFNKGQLALYDFLTWVLIVCRCCSGSDFLEEWHNAESCMFFQNLVLKGVAHMLGVHGQLPRGKWKMVGALLPLGALSLSRFVQQPRCSSEWTLTVPLGRTVHVLVRSETCSRSKCVWAQFQGEMVLNIDIHSLQPVPTVFTASCKMCVSKILLPVTLLQQCFRTSFLQESSICPNWRTLCLGLTVFGNHVCSRWEGSENKLLVQKAKGTSSEL